jgi:hypothetical protein
MDSHDRQQNNSHVKDIQLRIHAELQGQTIHSTSQRIPLTYVESMDIGGESTNVKLCESCFVHLHQEICMKTYANWKQTSKKRLMFDAVESNLVTSQAKIRKVKDSTTQHYSNILEARIALRDLNLEESQLHMACIPNSPGQVSAYQWLAKFFSLVGDHAPNRDNKVQLPGIYTRDSIYQIYCDHMTDILPGNEHKPLAKTTFMKLWKNIFPNVTISKFCHVSGKCNTCHWLYERQEVFRSERDLEDIKYFASIHKIMIEIERGTYVKKRLMAQEHPSHYMSLIIDGMSQDHCILPYCGNQVTKNVVLKQKIVGAKQHGFARSFYRAFPHIASGTNIAIEVVLHQIEKRMEDCKRTNKLMPDVLYLQIDGGPENTSKTFYAAIEQMVKHKIFREIHVCRLPVGHTHEDIDALFGVLWRSSRFKNLITPQDWKKMAVETFAVDFVNEE